MNPKEIAQELRQIADKLNRSKQPDKGLVFAALKRVFVAVEGKSERAPGPGGDDPGGKKKSHNLPFEKAEQMMCELAESLTEFAKEDYEGYDPTVPPEAAEEIDKVKEEAAKLVHLITKAKNSLKPKAPEAAPAAVPAAVPAAPMAPPPQV